MNIDLLPLDCLRSIFDQIPLQELIRLRNVCVEWNNLITHICAKKHSLELFESTRLAYKRKSMIRYYNYLHIDHKYFSHKKRDFLVNPGQGRCLKNKLLNGCSVDQILVKLFPKLTTLTIYYITGDYEIDLSLFLHQWSLNLTSLTLVGTCFLHPSAQSSIQQLWNTINSLPSLNKLHLFEVCTLPVELPVLSQLEHFTLIIDTYLKNNIFSVFSKFSSKLRFLTLGGVVNMTNYELFFININHLTDNLTHLTISHVKDVNNSDKYEQIKEDIKEILRLICETFVNLEYFNPKFAFEVSILFFFCCI